MKSVSQNLCTDGGDMLAYLYDEMPSADRDRFELHLSDCGTCIDDFAELSQSRFPVYEWKQLEFDPIPTPRITIDYAPASNARWFDKIRAAFALAPGYAFGGVAALLLVGAIAGVFVFRSGGEEIASTVEPSPSPVRSVVDSTPIDTPEQSQATAKPQPKPASQSKVEKVSARSVSRPVRAKTTTPAPKKKETVPVYITAGDDEDDSLRLSDIFAELDTSD